MHLDASHTHAAAAILADRRLQGLSGPCLPDELRPRTLEEALAIQTAVATHMGQAVGGWKCGTPGPGKLVVAPLYATTIHKASPCPAWAHEGLVRVEPELAFVIGHDLPVRDMPYAPEEVDAAIARTHLALELCDSRYSDQAALSFADKLADGLVNQGLFIGPEVDSAQAALTHTMQIDISVGDHAQPCRAGQHPDPLPRLPLYWLAEHLRGTGQGLWAGQVVITGSYAGTFGLPVGVEVRVRFGTLGELVVTLSARQRSAPR
jgi:2-keto-4-pentenoate hydratase